jgi:glycogen debranching enzyme
MRIILPCRAESRPVTHQPFLHDLAITLRAPVVCLSGPDGQIRDTGAQGVLAADVRVLSRAVVTVDGVEPVPVAHGVTSASAEHFVGVLREAGDGGADPTVWLRRDREVLADGLRETFTLVNRSERDLDVELHLDVDADLAAIETIKSGGRGGAVAPEGVTVTRDLPEDGRWRVAVPARAAASRTWGLAVRDTGAVVGPPPRGSDRTLEVHADDPRMERLLRRALDDLDGLLLAEPGSADVFAGAGAPWYLTLFGRDSLWTALMLLPVDPGIALGTLRTLARLQGTRTDPDTAEQPGKIPHERRRAAAVYTGDQGGNMVLPPLYYGTVDATGLWVCLLHEAWRHGLPAADVEPLLPHLEAALGWIGEHADRDGDGFAEYVDESGRGLANQGWKDSVDAVRFADGRIADGPVALAEVQGYHHEAALAGAALLEAFGRPGADRWRAYATDLAARFRERFWTPAGFPALALDGAKTPVDALTSNVGHLLGTGLLSPEEADRVGNLLLGPEMASGYGLRTMSSAAGGYSPLSYHCGSVWPHDTAVVIRGLVRDGQPDRAATLAEGLLAASEGFGARLPELLAGFGADEVGAPVPYPASCRPQAWAAGAAVVVLTAVLGLTVDVPGGVIRLAPPSPSPVGAVSVRGLVVAGGRLDVDLDRDGRVTHAAAPAGLRVVVA